MGVTAYEWGPKVQMEANRSWFFGLVFSILLSLYDLLLDESLPIMPGASTDGPVDEKMNGHAKEKSAGSTTPEKKTQIPRPDLTKIFSQLVIDSCDLFIPGAAVGWIPIGPLFIGTASTISTTVAAAQIWSRVQQKAKQP